MARAYEQFEARAFHPDHGNEAIEGTVFFTAGSLKFQGGEVIVEIPLQRLEGQLDKDGETRIILSDPAQPDWTIVTADTAILNFPSAPALTALSEQLESRATRREFSRRAQMVTLFFGGAVLVLWLGMIAMGAMVRAVVARIPPEMERDFGKDVLEELKGEFDFVDDTNAVVKLTELAQPLLRTLPRSQQWQFHIVDEPSPNAFALPGGYIIVTTGLLRMVERPEELLGVVAHEVAHVTRKHGFRQTIASAGPLLVFQVFLGSHGGALAAVVGGSAILVHQSFSQEYEKEADDVGWNYMVKANINPQGMIDVFHKLKLAEAGEPLSELVPQAFQSHPDLEQRIARLSKKWKRLARKTGFIDLPPETIIIPQKPATAPKTD